MFKYVSTVAILLFIVVSIGCSYEPTYTIDEDIDEDSIGTFKKFNGLKQIFSTEGISKKQDIVVYYVHGMGNHTSAEEAIVNFFNKIALEMGFNKNKKEQFRHISFKDACQ